MDELTKRGLGREKIHAYRVRETLPHISTTNRWMRHQALTASTTRLYAIWSSRKKEIRTVYMDIYERGTWNAVPERTHNTMSTARRWWPRQNSGVSRDLRFSSRRRRHPSALSCLTPTHTLSLQFTYERAREEAPRIKHIKKRIRSWTKSHFNGLLQQK